MTFIYGDSLKEGLKQHWENFYYDIIYQFENQFFTLVPKPSYTTSAVAAMMSP